MMDAATNIALIHRVLKACRSIDDTDGVHFMPRDDGSVQPWVILGSVFAWAMADAEDITPENVQEFERAVADVTAVCQQSPKRIFVQRCSDACILFACRVRCMRPFKHHGRYPVEDVVEPLIDAIPDNRPAPTCARPATKDTSP